MIALNEKTLGFYIKLIHNKLESLKNKGLSKFGLTSTQADVLIYLCLSKQEVNQRDIEKFFELSNPTVNGILNRLETKGFIRREVLKTDKRVKLVKVTAKAKDLYEQVNESLPCLEKRLRNGITEEEMVLFCQVIGKVFKNISLLECEGRNDERNF